MCMAQSEDASEGHCAPSGSLQGPRLALLHASRQLGVALAAAVIASFPCLAFLAYGWHILRLQQQQVDILHSHTACRYAFREGVIAKSRVMQTSEQSASKVHEMPTRSCRIFPVIL